MDKKKSEDIPEETHLEADYEWGIDVYAKPDGLLIESDPPDLLDDKVVFALRRAYYRPEFQDGQPITRTDLFYRHQFKYDKSAVDAVAEQDSQSGERLPSPYESATPEDQPAEPLSSPDGAEQDSD